MITKNFKNLLSMALLSTDSNTCISSVVVKDVQGNDRYIINNFSRYFPNNVAHYLQINNSAQSAGIWLGKGTATPTENDYALDNRIESGLSGTISVVSGVDTNGNPYKQFLITLTNSTASDIVVSEIGYVQQLVCSQYRNDRSIMSNSNYFLLDRTVLSSPVTVPAEDSAAVKYTLKTVMPS